MTKLYELLDEYRADVARLQELDLPPEAVLDTIDGMQGELVDKIKAVVIVAMELDAEAASRKQHATRMSDSAKALANRAEGLRSYAQIAIQNSGLRLPLKYPEFSINLKKNPLSCTVSDPVKLLPSLRRATVSVELPASISTQDFLLALANGLSSTATTQSAAQTISDSAEVVLTPDKAAVLRALKVVEEKNKREPDETKRHRLEGAYINPVGYRLSVD